MEVIFQLRRKQKTEEESKSFSPKVSFPYYKSMREEYKAKGNQYLKEGNTQAARECFQKAVDITPEMAFNLIKVIEYYCSTLGPKAVKY